MTRIITVGLGERAYAIHVGHGLIAQAGALIKPFAKAVSARSIWQHFFKSWARLVWMRSPS